MVSQASRAARCCDEYDEYQKKRQRRLFHRRDFLKTTVGALAAAPVMPHMLLNSAMASRATAAADSTAPILVMIQLAGGNDGLNTIIPYGADAYYKDRPNIAVPAKTVLPINSMVGFNPNLKGLKELYDMGKVAVLENVGYPNSSRSHFQGTAIWETADLTGTASTGWLGRYLDKELSTNDSPLAGIALGSMLPLTLASEKASVTAIEGVDSFKFVVDRVNSEMILNAYGKMYGTASDTQPSYMGLVRSAGADAKQGVADLQTINIKYTPSVTYPNNPLGRELQFVAQMISANLGTRIFHVSLGGFDDHVAEAFTHAKLMQYLGDSVNAFYKDLQAHNKADQVLMMTFSEFGRRVKENAGRGTDHGTAAPAFVIGGKVKGGYFGTDPSLTNLDANGDLKYGIDFRSVYGTILDRWLNTKSTDILGGSFESLPIL
jgi:uncharacterized protein (DUF1501 family)